MMSKDTSLERHITGQLNRLAEGTLHDPFSVLGSHSQQNGKSRVRVWVPGATTVELMDSGIALEQTAVAGLFEVELADPPQHHHLRCCCESGEQWEEWSPYTFPTTISDFDLHLFGEGNHQQVWRFLGADPLTLDGIEGVRFSVWAPAAERVSVAGDFNHWNTLRHPMRVHGSSGVWELFIPGVAVGSHYKFEIRNRDTGNQVLKADPYAKAAELRPGTASVVAAPPAHQWRDRAWMEQRSEQNWQQQPVSIYELHAGSWQVGEEGAFLNYRELAHRLVDYVKALGFTHIELMPVMEHPLDQSWGYQVTGYYAPTARYGSPDDLRYLVDHCHLNGIGVIVDWVPAHFPRDEFALARFDGTALYEHEDPRQGEHPDWDTLIFNYGRNEVSNFLFSNAIYWMDQFHIDGLRVDAVASMLYLDYSRKDGEWVPNAHGGRENLEAIAFLRQLNEIIHQAYPGAWVIAEESTAWPMVSRPVYLGGLGFTMKWNMGWMHDTLGYFRNDPIHRRYHQDRLTFGQLYAYTENFVLPLSHDEVVHGKGSLIGKMAGDEWQRFANLRLLYCWQFLHPGKPLLFMGGEFAQSSEWDSNRPLDWWLLQFPYHSGVQTLVADLNHHYRQRDALHRYDFEQRGFEWVDCHDVEQSIFSFIRWGDGDPVVVIFNMTPVPRQGYRIGLPSGGVWQELLNSDANAYGGSGVGNGGAVTSEREPWMGREHSVSLQLPPLAALVLTPFRE